MSRPPVVSNDEFSETVFRFADEVGPGAIWDLLVHAGDDLSAAARERAEETPERRIGWLGFAEFLERAIVYTSPAYVWKQLRTTIRVYEAYGVDAMTDDQRRRMEAASVGDDGGLEAPTPLEIQYMECPVCESEEFLVVMYDPAAILGRCASCGNETRSREELEAAGVSSEMEGLLSERTDAVETLARTRETIEEFEQGDRLTNVLKLVPLYRLEAQHLRRVRELTFQLARLMSGRGLSVAR